MCVTSRKLEEIKTIFFRSKLEHGIMIQMAVLVCVSNLTQRNAKLDTYNLFCCQNTMCMNNYG